MPRYLILIIIGALAILLLKSSTFGWRFFPASSINSKRTDELIMNNLKNHVYKLSYEIGDRNMLNYRNLEKATKYINEQFKTYGYEVETQEYICEDKKVENIIASKSGIKFADEIIIVGAHYDTCYNPGADDNASGAAGLLELARMMADRPVERTVKFIAFVNEEPPYFKTEAMGSLVYARRAKAKEEKIEAVLILESIGYYSNKPHSQRYPPLYGLFYPNQGNFIALVSNFRSGKLLKEIKTSFKKYSSFPIVAVATFAFITGVDFSDHWSFWQEGYPALMITDTAFLRNPHYHFTSDTYEKLDYQSIAEVISGFYSVVVELAKAND